MDKDTASAFQYLGLASKDLTTVMQSIRYNPEPEFVEAYMRAQKAMDEMAIFLTANINKGETQLLFNIEHDEDGNG